MRKLFALVASLILSVGFAVSASAQMQSVYMIGTIIDSTGSPVQSGTLTFTPVDNNGNPISYRAGLVGESGGFGQVITQPVTATIVAGQFSLTIADTNYTQPQNVCFAVTAIDNVTGDSLLDSSSYKCLQPSSNFAVGGGGYGWCYAQTHGSSATTCDLNNYSPNNPALTVTTIQGGSTTFTGGTVSGATTFQSTVTLAADPTANLQAATKEYVDNHSGSTFTGGTVANATTFQSTVTLAADPTANLQAATKQYVDNHAGSTFTGGTVANATTFQSTVTLAADPTTAMQAAEKQYVDYRNNTNPATYTFYVSGGTVYAVNNATTQIAASGTDAAVVINTVLAAMAQTGGTLYFKNGVYNLNSCTLETVSPYTSYCYAIGIPASGGGNTYPSFHFEGESFSNGTFSSEQGAVFNVTSSAETAAGSNKLVAFWQRPQTACQTGTNCFYWNTDLFFSYLSIKFNVNTHGNEIGVHALEASYLDMFSVQVSFLTTPTVLSAAGNTGIISPATPSAGVRLENVTVQGGWNVGFEIDTEHSVLINTMAQDTTTCYSYGAEENRNGSPIIHSGQWIHPQIFDCKYGVTVGSDVASGAQLDIIGLDDQYGTSGTWAQSYVYHTGNVGGFLSWGSITDVTGAENALTNPFDSGSGAHYTVSENGNLTANVASSAAPTVSSISSGGATVWSGSSGSSGAIEVTSTGTVSFVLTFPTAAAHFWGCSFNVQSSSTGDYLKETASNTTTVTVTGNTSSANEFANYICGSS